MNTLSYSLTGRQRREEGGIGFPVTAVDKQASSQKTKSDHPENSGTNPHEKSVIIVMVALITVIRGYS